MKITKPLVVVVLLALSFHTVALPSPRPPISALVARLTQADGFIRTELYFGMRKPDKAMISELEWSIFVDDVITPRFPEGFTVVEGKGQWRNKEGKIAKENSKVLIVVYRRDLRKEAGRKLDEIRSEYKTRFDQESVLRVDIKAVLVSF